MEQVGSSQCAAVRHNAGHCSKPPPYSQTQYVLSTHDGHTGEWRYINTPTYQWYGSIDTQVAVI